MARKLIRVSRRMLFTWFMLAGLILLFAPQNITNNLQFAFARFFRWPLAVGRNISLFTRTWQSRPGITNRREYENYIANLTEQLHSERKLLEELTRLRDRFGLQGADLVHADVVTASIGGSRSELIIYCRNKDGLAKGQFVLGDNSIIGTISSVSVRTARVQLFTDPASKMAVKIGKLNINRIMQGSGNDSAKITLLPTKHKVEVGDQVLAYKKPGFLDTSLIVGTVSQCRRYDENPSMWDITVKPACDIEKLNSVTVIIMNPPRMN